MTLDKMASGNQIKENVMCGACMGEKCIKDFHRAPE